MQIAGTVQLMSVKPSNFAGSFKVGFKIGEVWYSHFTKDPSEFKGGDNIEFTATQNGNFWNITKDTIKKISQSSTPPKNDLTSYLDKRLTPIDKKLNDIIDILKGTTTKTHESQDMNQDQQEGPESFTDDEIPF